MFISCCCGQSLRGCACACTTSLYRRQTPAPRTSCLNKRRTQGHGVVSPEEHLLDFRVNRHFEREEHVESLIAQAEAPEPVHAPHVQVARVRHSAHVEEARVNRRHATAWIEVVAAEECRWHLLGRAQLADVRPEA